MLGAMYLQMGAFNLVLCLIVFSRVYVERNQFRDCMLFSKLLIAVIAVDILDTAGWLLDGRLTGSLALITNVIDGLNLVVTAAVCWCWVQYVQFLAYDDAGVPGKKNRFSTIVFLVTGIAIVAALPTSLIYYIDENGVYCRSIGYEIVILSSLMQLCYSIVLCFTVRHRVKDRSKRKELFLIGLLILLPIVGIMLQAVFYGYSMIWTAMTVVILIVYIHIQNKRRERETAEQHEQLRLALRQAQYASKAKSDFLSNMSHDIRTPMNAIVGFTAIAASHIDEKPVVQNALSKITASSNHLLKLINDVLDMSRIESGKIQLQLAPCNLPAVIRELVDMVQSQIAASQLELFVDTFQVKDEQILADIMKLNQIFLNLISNAIKFNKPGGTVSIRIEQKPSADPAVGSYVFTVKDTGRGISPEDTLHIFEPFERSLHNNEKDSVEGTGLGLAIVKNIVELMGGTISVTSELGKGSEFVVNLRFAFISQRRQTSTESVGQLEDEPKPKSADVSFQGKRILLAEDHPLNREIAVRLLTDKGAQIEEAEDGQIAVDKFQSSREGYYDLILMDIRMPNANGYEAADAIRALEREDAKSVPIIAMTANAFDEDKKLALAHGMNAHLAKPLNVQQLLETLARYLG
ncbi:MAG: ATP-binding protein [Eubacteriales bacterium]|nr:ATP-binding protein [Eubacteriales bacterium]